MNGSGPALFFATPWIPPQEGLQYAFWSATSAILEHAALRAEASELGMESWLELRTQVGVEPR